jgi:hypothetical protein
MINKKSKIYIAVLISIVLFVPFSAKKIQGCGGDDPEDFSAVSLFAPEICGDDTLSGYFLSYNNFYGSYEDGLSGRFAMQMKNQLEWKEFIPNPINEVDMETLLYKLNESDMERLIKLRSQGLFQDSIIPFLLIKTRKDSKYEAALTYLLEAKRAESFANKSYYSWNNPDEVNTNFNEFASIFKKGYLNSEFEFLKQRYAFQWIRTLFFAGNYKEGIAAFDDVFSKAPNSNSIYNRSLGYKAACLYKLQNYSESNAIYAKLFDESKEQRFDAFFSFHPQEEEDWNTTLRLAKSKHDKEVLWQLFGIYADPIKGMKEILKLNPSSSRTMVLLMRALHIVEMQKIDNSSYEDFYGEFNAENFKGSLFSNKSWSSMPDSSNDNFISFIDSALTNNELFRPEVWRTTQAYLYYLNGQNNKASETLAQFRKLKTTDEGIRIQNKITETLIYIDNLKTISPKNEIVLLALLEGLNPQTAKYISTENTVRLIRKKLKAIYNAMNDDIHAEIAYSVDNSFYNDEAVVARMITFLERTNYSPMEKFLLSAYRYTIDNFYDLESTNELYKYNFEAALTSLSRGTTAGNYELNADPFKIRITDCHDCDFSEQDKKSCTKRSFIERLIQLKKVAQESKISTLKAESYFELANGLYNMTYYGNSRILYGSIVFDDLNLATREYKGIPDQDTISLAPYLDCREAAKYYALAANHSKDKEFKAKCIWMQAKCEHNLWLETGKSEGDFNAGINFKLLKEKYNNTSYYNEIIKECGYFCTFSGGENCIRSRED